MAIAKENTVVAFGRPNPMVIDRIPSQIEMYISAEFQRNLPGRALQKLTSFVEKDTVEVSFLIQDKKFEVSFPYKSGDDIKSLTNKAVEDFAIENFPEDFTKKILEKHGMGKQQLLELYLHLHELF